MATLIMYRSPVPYGRNLEQCVRSLGKLGYLSDIIVVTSSVQDPDPQDPHDFVPPGSASGSVIYLYGSGSEADFYCFVTSLRPFILMI
jgi:hypothetical protein